MPLSPTPRESSRASRRKFLQTSAAVGAAVTASLLALERGVHAAGSELLRVGLVGCGGRGSGAAVNALTADPNTRLVAMADLFPENIRASRENIKQLKGAQVAVDDDHCFTGFDGYQKVIDCSDVVLLALPTFFHPTYLKACVDAGKHVFCEKVHAVDAPGVRLVLESAEIARRKGLSIVSGLAWRYHTGVQETMKRVHDGAIGEIISLEETCNTGSLRSRARQPGWTEMQYQIQDWFNFSWLSCDLPGLNLVHDLDKGAWAMHDEPPVRCWGMGGRQTRVGPQYGDVWDHHAVVYEYANGTRMYAYCRQQDGTVSDVSDRFYGTKGRCDLLRYRIDGRSKWQYRGPECDRFTLEHVALFTAIRSGKPINNGLYMGRSSLLAIMATWACYTGDVITWDQAMKSNHAIAPKSLSFDAEPPTRPDAQGNYPIPVPGVTKFV
jgi:myo-inositol 2-dehydrogenase / D-chiro-inositol 1-dehydrogenase